MKTYKEVALVVMLVLILGPANAQSKKDSLWKVWNDPAAMDSNRLKAIQALTWPMLNVNLDSAFKLANKQLEFAKRKGDRKWIAKAYYNIATHYYLKGDYVNSLSFYQRSLEIRKEIGDLKGEAAIYGNFGLIYGQQGNRVKDLEYQLKSLAINERIRDTSNLTSNYNNIAAIYQQKNDSIKALEYYNQALRIHELKNEKSFIAIIYNNIGNLYRHYELYDKALFYLNKSLEVRTELNDILGMAINYVNLGTVYTSMGDFKTAKENTELSIRYFTMLGDSASLANSYYSLGDIALREKKYREAIQWCGKSYLIADASQKIAVLEAASSCLYRAYKAQGNPTSALYYFEEYVTWKDSMKEEDLQLELSRMDFEKELLTDSLSREAERSSMRAEHQTELGKRSKITNVILFITLCILILALVFLSRMLYFQRNTESLKRRTQELEKQRLVNEISLLKTQVNPHFLFNSLSILSSLVRVDPDLSERFIDQLSRSYRYILEQKDQSLVSLRTELGFIESYAFLLKIRFENKFNLVIDLPEEILDKYKIAPLTLQLLIENAVKHNRMSVTEPLVVAISIDENQMLCVKNKLQPRSTPTLSTGVGLQNIMNRYSLMTEQPVWAGETEDQFIVKIPLLQETNERNTVERLQN
jgi:tetratricopeptide (TPR) repeat protein